MRDVFPNMVTLLPSAAKGVFSPSRVSSFMCIQGKIFYAH